MCTSLFFAMKSKAFNRFYTSICTEQQCVTLNLDISISVTKYIFKAFITLYLNGPNPREKMSPIISCTYEGYRNLVPAALSSFPTSAPENLI